MKFKTFKNTLKVNLCASKKSLFSLGILIAFGIGIAQAQPLTESFDFGIPNGWTQNPSPVSWNFNSNGGNTAPGAMHAYDMGSTAGQGWFQTPWMSTSGMAAPQIDFSAVAARNNFISPDITLWYDIGNGWQLLETWTSVWGQNGIPTFPDILVQNPQTWVPQSSDWHNLTYDAAALAGFFTIRFSWGFEGSNGGALWLDDISISDATTNGITEKPEKPLFSLYPNPSDGRFTLQRENTDGISTIIITDALGKIVLHETIATATTSFNLSDLEKGIYLISITENDAQFTQRLVLH